MLIERQMEQMIRDLAAAQDARIRSVFTEAEIRANLWVIDQILARWLT